MTLSFSSYFAACPHGRPHCLFTSAILLLGVILAQPSWAMHVVFVSPGKLDEPFWRDADEGLQHAAASLGIELELLHAERDHLAQLSLLRDVAERPVEQRPDYLLVTADKQVLPGQLELAEGAGIPIFTAYNGVQPKERDLLGYPRQRFQYWLGSLVPDAEEAGFLSARALIKEAQARWPGTEDDVLELVAISGDRGTDSSQRRTRGMVHAVSRFPRVRLRQNVYGDWQQELARYQTPILLDRYPHTRLIWTGSDLMAFGASDGVRASGRVPGQDVLLSTINMTERATRALLNGELHVMVGGHHLAAAWALVVLYDYHNGVDFAESDGLEMSKSMFALFDQEMAQDYLGYLAAGHPEVDYCRFSKVCNPALKGYDFSIGNWLSAARVATLRSTARGSALGDDPNGVHDAGNVAEQRQ